ncbi:Hint domain-containing protein [Swingsia samuiensis]|nr:Hint domain-containing protein [Swingsia samuiensis]
MTKKILPGPYLLNQGTTSSPWFNFMVDPNFSPTSGVTRVGVTTSIGKSEEEGLDFFALQVNFLWAPWVDTGVHGGLQVHGAQAWHINWGGLVSSDTNYNGYQQNNPFDMDKMQNSIPQYVDLSSVNFNYNKPIKYSVELDGKVIFLPGYYNKIEGRTPYYVNHTRQLWKWNFIVSSTDGSFQPIQQSIYTNRPYISQAIFWDENVRKNSVQSKWTDFTYENAGGRTAAVTVSSSTINANDFFSSVQKSGGKIISGQDIVNQVIDIGDNGYIVENNIASSTINITSSGTVENNIISKGANIVVSSEGNAVSNKILGGVVTVRSGGIATWQNISSGGRVSVEGKGHANGTIISSGGRLEVSAGGIVDSATVVTGGVILASPKAELREDFANNGMISGGILMGNEKIYSGAQHKDVYVSGAFNGDRRSGYLEYKSEITVLRGGNLFNATFDNESVLTVQNGGSISGTVVLKNGASGVIGPTAGGTIDYYGDGNTGLTVSGLASGGVLTTVINAFPSKSKNYLNGFNIAGVKSSDIRSLSYPTTDQVRLQLKSGREITLNIVGVKNAGYPWPPTQTLNLRDGFEDFDNIESLDARENIAACFVKGSKIRLGSGEKAVESIEIGDEVVTLCPETQTYRTVPVIWVGRKRMVVDASRPEDQAGYPVRIVKDALGAGLPREDLVVTPEHCLYLNGGFVPARMLVNHRSIFYDRTLTDYDYFHIETAEHSILMANDVLTESYLDTGNRSTFEEQGNVVSLRSGVGSWEQDAAAPLLVEREAVEPLYREFEARAHVLGCVDHRGDDESLTTDPDLRLLTNDGTILSRKRSLNGRELFLIPQGTQSVQILSRTSRPSEVIGPFVDDRRELGVLIGAMDFFHAAGTDRITGHHTAADLWGWAELESASYRWTQGAAMLPITPEDLKQGGLLSIQVIAAGPYLTSREDNSPNPSVKIA